MANVLTRRDRCYLIGRRGQRLSPALAAAAWYHLAEKIEAMGESDVPKFNDLLIAFHVAAIAADHEAATRCPLLETGYS